MADNIGAFVRRRARGLCEYCQVPQRNTRFPHQVDHIIATKHRGPNTGSNLALACYACNKHKFSNISGIDPESGAIVRLFHPRRHKWSAHFKWDGAVLVGRTAIGRTTIEVLEINMPHRVEFRSMLIDEGAFPL